MTELKLAVDALILCVGRENFEKALHELGQSGGRPVPRREMIAEELRALGIRSNSAGFMALLEIVDIVLDRPGCQTGGAALQGDLSKGRQEAGQDGGGYRKERTGCHSKCLGPGRPGVLAGAA